MKILLPSILLFLLYSCVAFAIDVSPVINDQSIGAELKNIEYPNTLNKDLTSGLLMKVVFIVHLQSNDAQVHQTQRIEINGRYDLWKEQFNLATMQNSQETKEQTFQKMNEVVTFLTSLSLYNLFPVTDLPKRTVLHVNVNMLYNPIEKQRAENIRQWVNRNSVAIPSKTGIAGPSRSATDTWFNRIFNQFGETNEAAAWQMQGQSKSFVLDGKKRD